MDWLNETTRFSFSKGEGEEENPSLPAGPGLRHWTPIFFLFIFFNKCYLFSI